MVTPLKQPIVFELESFSVSPGYSSFLFILALFNYMVTVLGNAVVACIIVIDKNLHRPMFVMVCNLVFCDLLGATAVLPRLMMHFLTGQKKIGYIPAIAQAFSIHTYGVAMQTILGVMAYDRYLSRVSTSRELVKDFSYSFTVMHKWFRLRNSGELSLFFYCFKILSLQEISAFYCLVRLDVFWCCCFVTGP